MNVVGSSPLGLLYYFHSGELSMGTETILYSNDSNDF